MANKGKHLIENDYTPVTYDPQYILMVNHLKKYFPIKGGLLSQTVGHVKAVDGATVTIHRSEVLGLVGESGSGKSTTGRAIAGLQKVSGGSLNVLGIEMNGVKERDFKPKRADIGFVFQDPGSSFNPLMTIAENVAEPLLVHHKYGSVADAKNYVGDLLEMDPGFGESGQSLQRFSKRLKRPEVDETLYDL